jgi:tripartite-type tricarboxylate transporter receptor subunit TctC
MLPLRALVLLAAFCGAASAQPYPSRPIRLVLPYAPGGTSDAIARILGQKMGENLGHSLVIDNRPGGSGTIGRDLTAKAVPDGYTLMLGDAVQTINVHVLPKLPYHPVRDFTFITLIGHAPMAMSIHPTGPQTLKELIAQARSQPGRILYGMGGNGSITHLTGELFKLAAKVDIPAVPYKSIGLAINDLMGAQINIAFPTMPPIVAHVRAGRLRVLALSADKRASALPDVPTFAESGVAGVVVSNWFGLVGPARLPSAIVTKMREEAVRALQDPGVREKFNAMSLEIVANTAAEFHALVEADMVRWGQVVKQAGIRND